MSIDKNGHKLYHYITNNIFTCDSCSMNIQTGKLVLSCEECDYDLCENCFPKTLNRRDNEMILTNNFSSKIYRNSRIPSLPINIPDIPKKPFSDPWHEPFDKPPFEPSKPFQPFLPFPSPKNPFFNSQQKSSPFYNPQEKNPYPNNFSNQENNFPNNYFSNSNNNSLI